MLPFIYRQIPRIRRFPIQLIQPIFGGIGGAGNDIINIGGVGSPGVQGPVGPTGPIGLGGSVSVVPVTNITTTQYTALPTDYIILVSVNEESTVTLPSSPIGTVYIVKDSSGNATINPISVTTTALIDGAISAVINSNYDSLTFVYNGTDWNIV
jgi:hypothetical protein